MKYFRLFIISIVLLLFFISCNTVKNDDEIRSVFRYNEPAGISSLDPAYARNLANIWGVNQLFNSLVSLDSNLRVKASLARSWSVSDDACTYTFTLRDDVYFHDHHLFEGGKGRKLKASDIVFSLNRLCDPSVGSPGAWVMAMVKDEGDAKAIYAPNDSVVRIELKQAFPPFLGMLSMKYCSALPEEVVNHYGKDFRKHPVGTGPFYLKYWQEDVKLVFLKNPAYFERFQGKRLPMLDAVSVSFIADKQIAFLEFLQGKFDFLSGIDPAYKDELLMPSGLLNPKYNDDFRLIREPYLNTEYLGIQVESDDTLLDKVNVRKAINYGFDRTRMLKYLRNNIGIPGNKGFIPPALPGHNDKITYAYNPDTALMLMSQVFSSSENKDLNISLHTTSEYLDLCKYIQHELAQLGISLSLEVHPPATLKELKAKAMLPFFRASWIADYPDAENYLSLFYSKNFCPSGPNYTHFSDTAFDRLYEKSLSIVNDSARYLLYKNMDSLLMDRAPVVVLYYDEVLRFLSKKVHGLGSNPVNLLDLKYTYKD